MSNIPVYWKTRLDEVEDTLKLVKKGKVSQVQTSAGGRPIYQVEYGKSNLKKGTADNLSSALGARDIRAFADKTGEDYIPTIFIVGCVHGGEFEGTAAVLNMIKLIETGTDYAGNKNDALVEVSEKAHLIIIPMVNPDGRSHIPFDSYVGKTFYDLRYYNQGIWKDGSLCGWPECKMVHPIKDHVAYLGGYFNDDGVNMMHEDFFGEVSTGTRAVLDVCRNDVPDFTILLHGGSNTTCCMLSPTYASLNTKKEVYDVELKVKEACDKAGVRYAVCGIKESEKNENPPSFNLPSAMHHCCATPVVTYESNQGLCDHGNVIYDYDEIYKAHMILFEETIRFELAKFGKL